MCFECESSSSQCIASSAIVGRANQRGRGRTLGLQPCRLVKLEVNCQPKSTVTAPQLRPGPYLGHCPSPPLEPCQWCFNRLICMSVRCVRGACSDRLYGGATLPSLLHAPTRHHTTGARGRNAICSPPRNFCRSSRACDSDRSPIDTSYH